MKNKIIFSIMALVLFSGLLTVAVCQWNGVEVFESEGAKSGWWIGPFFNGMREMLGNKLSAVITTMGSIVPVYVAVQYWRGRI